MTISIDANILGALWNSDEQMSSAACKCLEKLNSRESLMICGPVYSELLAGPLREETALDIFLEDTGICVDWTMDEEIFRVAGRAFAVYANRRRQMKVEPLRRILADFLIGAHAQVRGFKLLTIDCQHYQNYFPKLPLMDVIAWRCPGGEDGGCLQEHRKGHGSTRALSKPYTIAQS
jgi:hypothetical protein